MTRDLRAAATHDALVFADMTKRVVAPTALLGVFIAAGAALISGDVLTDAARGTMFGVGFVLVFFTSTLSLHLVISSVAPQMALALAMALYGMKVSAMALVLMRRDRFDWLDPRWFAGAVVATTLVWIVLHVAAAWRSRYSTLEVDLPGTRQTHLDS